MGWMASSWAWQCVSCLCSFSGLSESVIAAACSRVGQRVLHVDRWVWGGWGGWVMVCWIALGWDGALVRRSFCVIILDTYSKIAYFLKSTFWGEYFVKLVHFKVTGAWLCIRHEPRHDFNSCLQCMLHPTGETTMLETGPVSHSMDCCPGLRSTKWV